MRIHVSPFFSALVVITAAWALVWGMLAFEDAPLGVRAPAIPFVSVAFAEPLRKYIEVTGGCGPHYDGYCVEARAGAGEDYRIVQRLRRGVVLLVGETITESGETWHKIIYDEPIRYPERLTRSQYVRANEHVRHFYADGVRNLTADTATTSKMILVDRSDQMLYAYDGDELVLQTVISTGIDITPTPRGTFAVYKKTPTRYMQGPLPGVSTKYYDLPGVPWNLYFTLGGGVIHGAYWHDSFGRRWSNGCVNVPLDRAEELYQWVDLGTTVVVRD